jgi:ATP-dependent DNA ligase
MNISTHGLKWQLIIIGKGVMLRKDVGYEGKRSKNLLKVKKFFDAEYTVVDCDVSP